LEDEMKITLDDRLTIEELALTLTSMGITVELKDDTLAIIDRRPPTGGWLPMSDHPDFLTDVLITILSDDGEPETAVGFLSGLGTWRLCSLDGYVDGTPIEPTAWQPLPDPYRGGPL
jgi:hypothetical protein